MTNKIENIKRHSELSEKAIERYLCKRVVEEGGLCLKYSSFTDTGYPDRLVMFSGICFWVELKSKGKKTTKLQEYRISRIRSLGFSVYVCDSKEKIDCILKELGGEL